MLTMLMATVLCLCLHAVTSVFVDKMVQTRDPLYSSFDNWYLFFRSGNGYKKMRSSDVTMGYGVYGFGSDNWPLCPLYWTGSLH